MYYYVHVDCLRPSGGASIFVKSSFPQIKIDLQTEQQATAISVTLDREITICSVYIPPSFSLNSQHLDNLLQQLPSHILLGDFNGHNILWGGQNNDSRGELIENKIDLQTEQQVTAISVTLEREITICSVYIPPSFFLNSQHLDNLLQQLPSHILLGDFNGHNILWGGQNNDSRGELIENFITKNDICIMNDKSYTYHSPSTKSFTSIDISFCHPSLYLDYNWSVCEDQHNSDHFPIIIEQNTFSNEYHNPKWKLK